MPSVSSSRKADRVEMLAIGDELLDGRVVESNSARAAVWLSERGLRLTRRQTVSDEVPEIVDAIGQVVMRAPAYCLVCGGLGPTEDDRTRDAFAAFSGRPLVRHIEWEAELERRYGERWTPSRARQADMVEGAEIIHNEVGSALGMRLRLKETIFVLLPGVPLEFDAMLAAGLSPLLRGGAATQVSRTLRFHRVAEADVGDWIEARRPPGLFVGYRPHFPELWITLKGTNGGTVDGLAQRIADQFSEHFYGYGSESMEARLLTALRERGMRLALAESCTGGLVAHRLTEVAGSSDVFLGGVVAYSNQLKQDLLGVETDILERFGAVSEETVEAMVAGIVERSGADCGIAISGVAGPGGGSPEKPVGQVCFATLIDGQIRSWTHRWDRGRSRNKVWSTYEAIHALLQSLQASPGSGVDGTC